MQIIDAVMTEDSDALVFGATHVIRGYVAWIRQMELSDPVHKVGL